MTYSEEIIKGVRSAEPDQIIVTRDDDQIRLFQKRICLRDWFAGMAAQGLLATFNDDDWRALKANPNFIPSAAYDVADAMMIEREKKAPPKPA